MTVLKTDQVLRAEANAIHGDTTIPESTTGRPLNRLLNQQGAAALCLSGGGIRSAAFALGVIRALAVHPRSATGERVNCAEGSLLGKFHFLLTVSGGGYIGGWLVALIARAKAGFADVWRSLVDDRAEPDCEPQAIAWLRRYSNYLTPKLGLTSSDTWSAVALWVRNLILIWLIVVPVFCAALLFLKLVAVGVAWAGKLSPNTSSPLTVAVPAGIAFLCLIVSVRFTTRHRPTRGGGKVTQSEVIKYDLLPALVSGLLLTLTLAIPYAHDSAQDLNLFSWSGPSLVLYGSLFGAGAYGFGWILARPQFRGPSDFWGDLAAWVAAGIVYGAFLGLAVFIHRNIYGHQFWEFDASEVVLLVGGLPWVIVGQLIAEMIFVGLSSSEAGSYSDREWLGRAAGWFIVAAVAWMVVMFLTVVAAQLAVHAFGWYTESGEPASMQATVDTISAISAFVSGVATSIFGKYTPTRAQGAAKTGFWMNVGLAIAVPIFVVTIIIVISGALDAILLGVPLLQDTSIHGRVSEDALPPWPEAASSLLVGLGVVAAVGLIASKFVNINRFSLHALYRNRIIRGFLGASNPARQPDPFTGFDEADNLPMHDLWFGSKGWRPFHVVNMALNIVSTENLARKEPKAVSFTVSPLHAGSANKGYRASDLYCHEGRGISLGTAVAISGAAASPNMGYHSSAVTFLLALFNVRLGWWLGNPGEAGNATYRKDGPTVAVLPLLDEFFGLSRDDKPWVYLTDGGHFENLGLYEMVRRRCRFIVLSDAGCDPDFAFEDLGNAVRKIKLDLGIVIRFHGLQALRKRSSGSGMPRRYHAIGEIDYRTADSDDTDRNVQNGLILYVKPGYHGCESIDIRSYATANDEFPHESTADQWFSESRFESYRALGFEIMDGVLTEALARLGPSTKPTLEAILTGIFDVITRDVQPEQRIQEMRDSG